VRARLLGLALALAPAPLAAQDFAVPEGFVVLQEAPGAPAEDLAYLFTLRPAAGAFAELSAIELSEVRVPVADADAWLRGRMTGDVDEADDAQDLFTSPDSPFADPAFDALRKAIPELFRGLQALAELPLEFCDGPQTGYNASGAFRELYCVFNVGPIRQYLVLRLQRVGERWFYTRIQTMNERRLRHLLTIADSFSVGG
jgi:hypothetical protein